MQVSDLKIVKPVHEFESPIDSNFKVQLAYLSKQDYKRLRDSSIKVVWKNGRQVEDIDDLKFYPAYTKAVIKGWTGLTLGMLKKFVPVDAVGVSDTEEIPYSEEAASFLMLNSRDFDVWVASIFDDLSAFEMSKREDAEKNSQSTSKKKLDVSPFEKADVTSER